MTSWYLGKRTRRGVFGSDSFVTYWKVFWQLIHWCFKNDVFVLGTEPAENVLVPCRKQRISDWQCCLHTSWHGISLFGISVIDLKNSQMKRGWFLAAKTQVQLMGLTLRGVTNIQSCHPHWKCDFTLKVLLASGMFSTVACAQQFVIHISTHLPSLWFLCSFNSFININWVQRPRQCAVKKLALWFTRDT